MYWLVEHPLSQYEEDVKAIAIERGLRIVDKKLEHLVDPSKVAKDAPDLNVKGAKKKTRKSRKKTEE